MQALRQLGPAAPKAEIVELASELSVRATMKKFLMMAPTVKTAVLEGSCQVHGGIYDLCSGQVRFLPPLEDQETILGGTVPLFGWKQAPYVRDCQPLALPAQENDVAGGSVGPGMPSPPESMNPRNDGSLSSSPCSSLGALHGCPATAVLSMLASGNARYLQQASVRRVDRESPPRLRGPRRRPQALILAPADGRVPVERIFDSEPGDLLVQRSAGSFAGQQRSSLTMGAEHAVLKHEPKVLLVLAHGRDDVMVEALNCALGRGAIGGQGMMDSVARATLQMAPSALRAVRQLARGACSVDAELLERMLGLAVELHVLSVIEQLLAGSPLLREAAMRPPGQRLELHGAIYDSRTGTVCFLGQHPRLHELLTPAEGAPEPRKDSASLADETFIGG